MKRFLLAGLSTWLVSISPTLAAQCPAPRDAAEMRAMVQQAGKMTPARLRELAPNAHLTTDWSVGPNAVALTNLAGVRYNVDLSNGAVERSNPLADDRDEQSFEPGLALSPNGDKAIAFDGYDLVLVDMKSGVRRALTSDGQADLAYGYNHLTVSGWLEPRLAGYELPPAGFWSPDGRYFAALKVDRRGLRDWPVMIAGEEEDGHRLPTIVTNKMAVPGDEAISKGALILFDTETGKRIDAPTPPLVLTVAPVPTGGMRWSEDGGKIYVGVESRDLKTRDVWTVDAATGEGRVIYTEKSDRALRDYGFPTSFWPIGDTSELLVYSQRDDGRGHFYVYDMETGKVLRRLTKGDWTVLPESYGGGGASAIDVENRQLYFTAAGREAGRDPYYQHLYRISLDGGEVELLTPEDKNHAITISLDHGVFVDQQSTVGGGAKTIVRRLDGALVAEVAQTDLTKLKATGWTPPQRVRLLAADGKTPIWGTLTAPPKIEGARCHPILDSIYAGPQSLIAPVDFLAINWMYAQTTAQMGFAVLQLDSRGTPLRDRAFSDATYGRDFGSRVVADDHAAAIKQLADRFDYIDPERAGVYGASWGGYYTLRLMGQRPDVFKVGVASSGSHDNYLYTYEHDRWFGMSKDLPDTYQRQSNFQLASRIEGKLLLTHGTNDDDTHVMNSFLMAGALAEANVRFDMLILPDRDHNSIIDDPYVILRTLDYFTRHLLGSEVPFSRNITDDWRYDGWSDY